MPAFDRTVSRIENHDAIVEASLQEGRRAQAQARVRLRHVQRDGDKLKTRRLELENQIENWAERARATHEQDRQKALECVRRRKSAIAELDRVTLLLDQHHKLDSDIRQSLNHIDQRLQEMTQQRNQLRTRESAAQAQKILSQIDSNSAYAMDDTFERWEVSISESEIFNDAHSPTSASDDFDAQFVATEQSVELECDLDELLGQLVHRHEQKGISAMNTACIPATFPKSVDPPSSTEALDGLPADEPHQPLPQLSTEGSSDAEESKGILARVTSTIRRVSSVSELVRFAGIGAVIISMFMFLVDGVEIANDQQRFYTMLLFTGLLGGAGLALGWLLKENRGARAFFGLALVSVPVNFAVLGALAYSLFGLDAVATDYPSVALWTVGSIGSFTLTSAIAFMSLLPVTFIAFSVMARQSRHWLTPAFIASSAMLLIPLRQSAWIVPLVALGTLLLLWLVRRHSDGVIPLKTAAGRFARVLLFLPPGIMLVRSLWLYQIDLLAGLVVTATAFIVVRHLAHRVSDASFVQNLLHVTGATLGLIGALLIELVVAPFLPWSPDGGIFALATAVLTCELHPRIAQSTLRRTISICGTGLAVACGLLSIMLVDSTLAMMVTIVTALVLLAHAVINRLYVEAACAMGLLLATAVVQLDQLLWLFTSAGWWGIASAGAAAIVLASVLERHGAAFALRCKQWFSRSPQIHVRSD